MTLIPSASQTVGPFFNFGLTTNHALGIMAPDDAEGEHITLIFRVIDGEGQPTPGDSMIELWQADSQGRYQHPVDPRFATADKNFSGFGRLETDANGVCVFETVKPGSVVGRRGHRPMAPHINFWIVARGINIGLNTRMYFSDEAAANGADPVLNLVEPDVRRQTLIAQREQRGTEVVYRFDIYLQGDRETVFFDV